MAKDAGIVLAGGQSSRMGTNKALLRYKGVPLVEYMQNLLVQTGLNDVFISGDVPGYAGLPDQARYHGPAQAMIQLLRHFEGRYRRLLFVPVDMPLIESGALRGLLEKEGSVYYEGYPLPACIVTGDKEDSARSVRELLESRGAQAISFLPAWEEGMANLNTQQEWERATQ